MLKVLSVQSLYNTPQIYGRKRCKLTKSQEKKMKVAQRSTEREMLGITKR